MGYFKALNAICKEIIEGRMRVGVKMINLMRVIVTLFKINKLLIFPRLLSESCCLGIFYNINIYLKSSTRVIVLPEQQ